MKITEKKSLKKIIKIFIIITVFIICAGAIIWGLWGDSACQPRWVTWESICAQDASGEYEITLAQKRLSVAYRENVIWTSPDDVKVQKALSCDIDHDGQDELILLCWKKGHYGDVKPIWAEEDKQEWVQHIFVYEYEQEDVEAKWMSSYIGRNISDITACETKEGNCCLCLTDTDGEASSWVWDSWGFTKIEN